MKATKKIYCRESRRMQGKMKTKGNITTGRKTTTLRKCSGAEAPEPPRFVGEAQEQHIYTLCARKKYHRQARPPPTPTAKRYHNQCLLLFFLGESTSAAPLIISAVLSTSRFANAQSPSSIASRIPGKCASSYAPHFWAPNTTCLYCFRPGSCGDHK